ncbi:unnamed protein product [Boreogadus saida]
MTLKWSSSGAVQKLLSAIVRKRQWCEMFPCLEDEGCDLLVNRSGWTCTQPGGRVKTTTPKSVIKDRMLFWTDGDGLEVNEETMRSEQRPLEDGLFRDHLGGS